jgi:aspartate-semialdehyde dehydrogenase
VDGPQSFNTPFQVKLHCVRVPSHSLLASVEVEVHQMTMLQESQMLILHARDKLQVDALQVRQQLRDPRC